jgi:hypothetical protein
MLAEARPLGKWKRRKVEKWKSRCGAATGCSGAVYDRRPMLRALQDSSLATWVVGSDSIWAYPTVLTLHTVGLAVIVGTAFVIDLRTLGVGPDVPLQQMRQTLRLFWTGFAINLVSGLVLFATAAVEKARQPVFYVKLTLIAAAIVVTTRLAGRLRAIAEGSPVAAALPRSMAILSLMLWAGAIVAGRLMAYL